MTNGQRRGYAFRVIRKRQKYRRPKLASGPLGARDVARASALRQLAEAYLANDQCNAAADVLRQAVVFDAENLGLRMALGGALYWAGRLESALRWLDPLAGRSTLSVDLLRGRILSDLHLPRQAVAAFALYLAKHPEKTGSRLRLAEELMTDGRAAEAIKELDRCLQDNPNCAHGRELRAAACLEAGNPKQALADLAAIDPAAASVDQYLLQIRAQMLAGHPNAGIEKSFRTGLARFPHDPRLLLAFGRALTARRNIDPEAGEKARAVLGRLTTIAEAGSAQIQAQALFLLAELAAEKADGLDEAQELYHRGLALQPEDPGALAGMGRLLLDQGLAGHAMPWFLQSLVLDPERPQTIESLAQALGAIVDDEAVARWLGLITAALPAQSPTVLTHLLRFIQEAGRSDAYQEVRREGHRMKNLVAVAASRADLGQELRSHLDGLYQTWSDFLQRIQQPAPLAQPVAPAELVQAAIRESTADPSQVSVFLPAGLPPVQGDLGSLTDALTNILRNAIEASPAGRPVRLGLRCQAGSRWLELAISDEGPGISLETRRRIFDPGYSTREGGSGLGLTIARRVIRTHGGRIAVASAPGGPTTFTIRLPIALLPMPNHFLRRPIVKGCASVYEKKKQITAKTNRDQEHAQ